MKNTFTGRTSFSKRLVLKSLTPQLISKPTPPGETTDLGSFMSNAAIFPEKFNQLIICER